MDDKKVSIDSEILKEIFNIAKMKSPDEITEENLLGAIFKLKNPDENQTDSSQNKIENNDDDSQNLILDINNNAKNILVIDDIGIVTYQLKILLRNLGYNVQVARDIFSGLNIFIKSNYDFVIMDLFVSTEQEGFTLLNETKKIIEKNNLDTKIIVITASSKAENKVKCLNGGADVFLKKESGWQDKLIETIENLSIV